MGNFGCTVLGLDGKTNVKGHMNINSSLTTLSVFPTGSSLLFTEAKSWTPSTVGTYLITTFDSTSTSSAYINIAINGPTAYTFQGGQMIVSVSGGGKILFQGIDTATGGSPVTTQRDVIIPFTRTSQAIIISSSSSFKVAKIS